MKLEVKSSIGGTHWYIVNAATNRVVEGAPKRGHGAATKAQMIAWAKDLEALAQ